MLGLWLALAAAGASGAKALREQAAHMSESGGTAPRRKGGARPGNKHALKNGRSSRDPMFSALWASLTDEQRKTLYPMVKEQGHLLPTIADYERSLREAGRLTDIDEGKRIAAERQERDRAVHGDAHDASAHDAPSTHIHTDRQHDIMTAREGTVLRQLMAIGFYQARVFVERHAGALEVIEALLEEMQVTEDEDPVAARSLISKGGLVRRLVHEAVMIRVGNLSQCPYCDKREYVVVRPPSAPDEKGAEA